MSNIQYILGQERSVIGLDKRWNLLYVVYVERENDVIRIISARKATRKEREYYEN